MAMTQRMLCWVLLGAWASGAGATNGYFSHGYSLAQKAMGGAGTALPGDSMIAAINPAGVFWVGNETSFGLSLFNPRREYSAFERGEDASNGIMSITPGNLRSHNEYFPIPGFSMSRPIGDWASWGLAMYGNGGMNTEFRGGSALFAEGMTGLTAECNGSFGGGEQLDSGLDPAGFCANSRDIAGVDMAIMFIAPSFAMRLGDRSSVGLAPLFVLNRFAAQGLNAFAAFSNSPDQVSDKGHDLSYGIGYRVGFLTGLVPLVSIGGSYQGKIGMSEFEDYAGLFAGQGSFDIPETWNLGLAFRLGEDHRLVVDYQQINYSDITSVGNVFDSNDFVNNCALPRLFFNMTGGLQGSDAPSPSCLGAGTGPGFGWEDMGIYKLGYQYSFGGYQFRVGYSWTEQPIREDQILFNVLAPGVVEKHYTVGLGLRWSENFFIDTAFSFMAERPVRGKNPLSNTDADLLSLGGSGAGFVDTSDAFGIDDNDQDIELNMKQFELSVGFSWRY